MSELEGITPLSKELLELLKVEINLVNVASKLADLLTLLELDERSLEDDDVPPPLCKETRAGRRRKCHRREESIMACKCIRR